MNPGPLPREPRNRSVWIFRELPTRIQAIRGEHGWGIVEGPPTGSVGHKKNWELDCRADWRVIWPLGLRLCRVLAGRTVEEANLQNVPPEDFAGALVQMSEREPWWLAEADPARGVNGRFAVKRHPRYRRRSLTARLVRLPDGRVRDLTRREREILALLCRGLRSKQISEMLAISERTVETHRVALYRKADVAGPAPLAIWAVRKGYVKLEESVSDE